MDIGEGANHHNINYENIKALQFITHIISNNTIENMLDSDSERILNNNNTLNYRKNGSIRKRNENLRIQKDYYNEEVSTANMNSKLGGNTTKLNHRKKLYSGRDSPVDLVPETHNNRSSTLKPLHPALDGSVITNGYGMNKKKRMSQFGILTKNMNDNMSLLQSPRVRRKRKNVRSSKFRNICTPSLASRKRRDLLPASIVDNMIKKKSAMDAAVNTIHEMEGERDNLTPLNDEQQCKILNNGTEELTQSSNSSPTTTVESNETITPHGNSSSVTCLQRPCNIQKVADPNKTEACLSDMNAVIRLKRLPESSYIQKIENPNRTATTVESNETITPHGNSSSVTCLQRPCNIQKIENTNKTESCLSDMKAVVRLERLSESDIQKYKSNKSEMRHINLNPVVSLKRLSESDIQQYKPVKRMTWARLVCSTSTVESFQSDTSFPENTDPIIFIPEDIDSDQNTIIMTECQNSSRNSISSDSDLTVIDEYPPVATNGYVNFNLKKKSTFDRRNETLNDCILRKKSKREETEYCRCNRRRSIANKPRKLQEKDGYRSERQKNLKSADDDVVITNVLIRNKKIRKWTGELDRVTNSDVSKRSYRTSNKSDFNRNKDTTAISQKHLSLLSDNNKSPTVDFKYKNHSKFSEKVLSQNSHDSEDIENSFKKLNRPEITIIRKGKISKSVEKFEIGEDKNTSYANYIDTQHTSLKNRYNATPRLPRARTRKTESNKNVNSQVLCFRTKIFDSDIECSPYS